MLADLALAISVMSLLVSVGALWYSRKQTQLAHEAIALSARSASSSEVSALAAKEAVSFGQRPYMTVKDVQVTRRGALDIPVSAILKLTNTGTTPALDIKVQIWLRAFEVKPIALPLHDGKTFRQGDLGAGDAHDLTVAGGENYELKASLIVSGRSTLYIYGQVRYRDVAERVHYLDWCYRYLPQTKQFAFDIE